MQVVGYCRRCPLNGDPLAEVHGMDCPWGCRQARVEHPPRERSFDMRLAPWDADRYTGMWVVFCPNCGTAGRVERLVLDIWTQCHGLKTGGCKHIFKVKGTGSWLTKWITWMRLPSQVRQDRRVSGLRP